MAENILSEEGALQKGASTVSAAHSELTSTLASLSSDIHGIGNTWEGAAKAAFDTLMNQWDQDARDLVNVLNRFEQDLLGTQKDFTAQDTAGQSSLSKVQSRLGVTRH